MSQGKTVAVVGAGSSGITAAKCLLDDGLQPTVFEQTDQVGGNWVFREEEGHSSVYRSTFINTSREIMAYSDYPMPEELPDFPHHSHIVTYFNSYVDHFGFRDRIRFETRVERLEPLADGRWRVTSRGRDDGDERVEEFDAVAVCNGHHWCPRWPSFPGQDDFPGELLHSHGYKDPASFEGKTVVVVGIGNSAVDISVELSRVARQVYLSTRRGAYVLPKYIFGRPLDHLGVTRMNLLTPWFIKRRMMRWMLDFYQGPVQQWGLPQPRFQIHQTHPTISSELLGRLGHGAVRARPDIERFEGGEVVFEDGERVAADAVIFCTGYSIRFPFLDSSLVEVVDNRIDLYRRVFHPELPNLGFIGLVQPLGALMPIAEMQTRWFSRVLRGVQTLPEPPAMKREIERMARATHGRYVRSARHTIQVDFLEYMDEIAGVIGVRPRLWKHPLLLPALLLGPATPAQYRLDGPGRWSGAAEVIRACFRGRKRPKVDRQLGPDVSDGGGGQAAELPS